MTQRTGTQLGTPLLFLIPTLIWGSTWLVILWQLGDVAPEVSVCYRFALAALILAAWCMATRRSLRFSARNHLFLAALGMLNMGFNYVWIYHAERHLTGDGQDDGRQSWRGHLRHCCRLGGRIGRAG